MIFETLQELRKRRERLGISQEELAKHAHVSHGTVANIENPYAPNPSLQLQSKVVDAISMLEALAAVIREWHTNPNLEPITWANLLFAARIVWANWRWAEDVQNGISPYEWMLGQ